MRSRSQGGVHTSLTRTSLTPGTVIAAFSTSPGMLFALGPLDIRRLGRRRLPAEIEIIAMFVLARHPLPLFRLDRRGREPALQRRLESMPRQGRAFDAHRESLDAGQRLEALDIVLQRFGRLTRLAAGDARVELRKERSRFG